MTAMSARHTSGRPAVATWVLVSDHVDGRSRSAVATVRALAAAGYRPGVTVSGGRSAAAASRFCAATVTAPRPGEPGFLAAVDQELRTRAYAAVLPASDATLIALGRPGAALVDKSVLPARAAAAGLRMPETTEFADAAALADAADSLAYPLVVKPSVKSGPGAIARRVDGAATLRRVAVELAGPTVVQPFRDGAIRAVCGVIHDGALRAVVHQTYLRIWPRDCGVACAAATVPPDLDLESRLPALLAGHDGVFQLQLVDGLLIDVNPRVYGSLPLAVAAGANLPAIAVAAAQGHVADLVRGRPGVRYRWLEGDLRRVAHGVRAGRIRELTALLPRPGTAHSVESLRDPGPAVSRLVDVASRWLS